MFIPDDKVEEVRAATDILDVVGDYVRLKRRGSNYFGLSPFKDEKTPSFSVSPSKGIFKCFSSGQGGDVFTFIRLMENVEFPEAVRMLAERANIPLPVANDQAKEAYNEYEAIYNALRFAARFFYERLTRDPAGKEALIYLQKRGFQAETIKRFGLGYALDAWDGLIQAAQSQHISEQMLEKAGLVIPRQGSDGYYDRYRGRVIFPIFSHVGKVLGFGGRILQNEPNQPKYINSPETKVYHKSEVLYGLYQAKQAIRKKEEVILVEGYTDVISLHQAGVQHVVASSGTSLTKEQVKIIGRYAKRVLMLFDADAAGANAALRGIDIVLEQGFAAYAVSLPGGEDPDSYVQKHGAAAFEAFVEVERMDFVAFKYHLAKRSGQMESPEGQSEAIHAVVSSIARITDEIKQQAFIRRTSEVFRVPDLDLFRTLDAVKKGRYRQERRRQKRAVAAAPAVDEIPPHPAETFDAQLQYVPPRPEEKMLVRLMIEQGDPMVELILGNMGMDEFTPGAAQDTVSHIMTFYNEGVLAEQRFFDPNVPMAVQNLVSEVMVDRYEPSENWRKKNIEVPRFNEDPQAAAISAMTLLKLDRVNEAIEGLKQQLFQASGDPDKLRAIQKKIMHYQAIRKQVERHEFLQWHDH